MMVVDSLDRVRRLQEDELGFEPDEELDSGVLPGLSAGNRITASVNRRMITYSTTRRRVPRGQTLTSTVG